MDFFAERLKYLRERNEISQAAIAKILHMSQSGYFSYEAGKSSPPPETLIKLADYYRVSIDYLLGYEPENKTLANLFHDINNLPNDRQRKVAEYVRLLKVDLFYQAQQNKKNKKHIQSAHPPGLAALGGGVKEVDEEIKEDLQNLENAIRNDSKE